MPIELFYTVQDAKGQKSTITVPIPEGTSYADAVDFLISLAEPLRLLTTGGLYSAGVTFTVDLSASNAGLGFGGWGPVAALDSDVQEKGEFIFRTANNFLKRINLPTFDEQFFVPQSTVIDTADATVAEFVTAIVDGITLPSTNLVNPVDSRDEDIVQLVAARENWGKRRL